MAYTTIDKPTDYFNTKTYNGTGSELAITGVGFQPDWIWFKQRNAVRSHAIVDSVRGRNKVVFADLTNAEETSASATNDLVSFDSDGFTVGTTSTSGSFNTSSGTHVAWNWLASNTTASNTDGSITSTVSANTTAGFSIVSYTGTGSAGATIGHGLGSTPQVIIIKNRSSAFSWEFGHSSIASDFSKKLKLDTTSAEITDTGAFNNTAPTSSVFTVGVNSSSNGSGNNMIAYCFTEKKGYSKFGSYTGNGSTDGSFIFTGMKPSMIIVKRTDTTGNWRIYDNKRDTFNYCRAQLSPNLNNAESNDSANTDFDFLSNGFKARGGFANINASGGTYIYMAFAENPFVSSGGIPCTAR